MSLHVALCFGDQPGKVVQVQSLSSDAEAFISRVGGWSLCQPADELVLSIVIAAPVRRN